MDRYLSYGLSLFVSALGSIVGVGLVWSGVTQTVTMWAGYQLITKLAELEATLGPAGAIAAEADNSRWLMLGCWSIGMVVIGIGLAYFFGSRLVKRIKCGLPDDSEGAAKTTIGRLGSNIVFVFGIFLGVSTLAGNIYNSGQVIPLVFAGVSTKAEILEVVETSGREVKEYKIRVGYKDLSGVLIEQEINISDVYARSFKVKNEVGITYAAANPEVVTLTRWLQSPLSYLWSYIWPLCLIIMGGNGVRRNSSDQHYEPIQVSQTPILPVQQTTPQIRPIRGTRKQFGRR